MTGEIFAIALVAILAATLMVCLPIVLVFWLVARRKGHRHPTAPEEERLRKIGDGLQKMEQRVENLETILHPPREDTTRRRAARQPTEP